MVSLNDVDICVTCVSDKPPKLPLREELVSLGVEVIYKAAGVGAKAVKHESKAMVKNYRTEVKMKKRRRFRVFPKSREEKLKKKEFHKDVERRLYKTRSSVSYDAYNERLQQCGSSDDSSSLSSMSSVSTPQGRGGSKLNEPVAQSVMAAVPEGRECSLSDYQDATDPVSGEIGIVLLPSPFGKRTQSQYHASSTATSPTASNTTTAGTLSLVFDDEASQESTFDKKDREDKPLISATGNRWWYQTEGSAPKVSASRESGRKPEEGCLPPHIPALDDDAREQAPTTSLGNGIPVEVQVDDASFPVALAIGLHVEESTGEDDKTQESNTITSQLDANDDPLGQYKKVLNEHDCQINEPQVEVAVFTHNDGEKSLEKERVDLTYLPQSELTLRAPSSESYSLSAVTSQSESDGTGTAISKKALFAFLALPSVKVDDVRQKFEGSPYLANVVTKYDGRTPLHVACNRPLPDRFRQRDVSFLHSLDFLLADIVHYRAVMEVVLMFNVEACKVIDKNGDLPLHLAARRLIEWEGQWRTKMSVSGTSYECDQHTVQKMCTEMTRCIEVLIDPVLTMQNLCRKRGCVGRLLPLHVACIFNVSYERMNMLLESYPEASGVPCDFGGLLTLLADDSLPLELLDKERIAQWQSADNQAGTTSDMTYERLSDLVFAFHPHVDPFRFDPVRLERIETMIVNATRRWQEDMLAMDNSKMDAAAERAWIWMCTFEESFEGMTDDYSQNVRNIVNKLEVDDVHLLSSTKFGSGTILAFATSKCQSIIIAKLDGEIGENSLTKSDVESPLRSTQVHLSVAPSASSLTGSLPKMGSEDSLPSSHKYCPKLLVGGLLKRVFNIREETHPTSFIILPYKLVDAPDGTLTLDSPTRAPVAVKFAQYLLEMTDPKFLKHYLEKKSIQHVAFKLAIDKMEEWTLVEEKYRNIQRELLEIYRSHTSYLYLLDEKEGIPLVKGQKGEKYYPIRIEDPYNTVRRMLPLMLMGMIQMRGEKSLSILIRTIIEGGQIVPESWIETAEEISAALPDDIISDADRITLSALAYKKELFDFLQSQKQINSKRRSTTADGYEWVVELTLLKLSLDQSDIRRTYAGLQPLHSPSGEAIWTLSRDIDTVEMTSIQKSALMEDDMTRGGAECAGLAVSQSFSSVDTNALDLLLWETPSNLSQQHQPNMCLPPGHNLQPKETEMLQRQGENEHSENIGLEVNPSRPEASEQPTDKNFFASQEYKQNTLTGPDDSSHVSFPSTVSRSIARIATLRSKSFEGYYPRQSKIIEELLKNEEIRLSKLLSWSCSSDQNDQKTSLTESDESKLCSISVDSCDSLNSSLLRDKIEKQEAHLDSIRARLSSLDIYDEEQFSLYGEKLVDDLSHQLSIYDANSTKSNLSENEYSELDEAMNNHVAENSTKRLLMRLCNLEERLLTREIELQQVKLDLHNFELESIHSQSKEWDLAAQLEVD